MKTSLDLLAQPRPRSRWPPAAASDDDACPAAAAAHRCERSRPAPTSRRRIAVRRTPRITAANASPPAR